MTGSFFSGAPLSLTQRLNNEAKDGTLDIARAPIPPSVPSPGPDIAALRKSIQPIKDWIDQAQGVSGSVLDKHLTLRDLMAEGAMSIRIGNNTYSGGTPSAIDLGSGYSDPRPTYAIPPAATGLTAQGAFKNVVLDWSLIDFANFAYTEVYRSNTNARGAATLIGTTTANLYTDANVVVGATYYYWVSAVTQTGARGPDNAVSGTSAALLTIGNTDLGPLVVTAEKLSQGTYPNINLVPNGNAEDGTVCWTLAEGAAATFTVDPTTKTGGTQGFKVSKTAVGVTSGYGCLAFPVIPGETYSVKARVRGDVASAAGLYIIMWEKTSKPSSGYANASDFSSYSYLASNVGFSTAFPVYEFTYVVPAGVYWASVMIESASNSTPSKDFWFDDVSVGRQITASFLAANSIAVGTAAIQNGAIVNAMIANLTVDNAKIANLDGAKINAGTITAGQIAAGTITATQIQALTITGALIAANTITAGKIISNGLDIKDVAGNVILAAGNSLDWSTRFPTAYTTGLPSNNATADVKLRESIGTGQHSITGNTIGRITGGSFADAVASTDGFTGGAACSFVAGAGTSTYYIAGLSDTPAGGITGSPYAFIMRGTSTLGARVPGGGETTVGTYVSGDVLAVTYDGQLIRWLQNGAVVYSQATTPGQKFYFQASVVTAPLTNVQFGPMSPVTAVNTLVASSGVQLNGNNAKLTNGTTWSEQVYSRDAYVGGAFASAVLGSTNATAGGNMFGLNSDPLTDASYTSLDYAIHTSTFPNLYAYESNVATLIGSWAAGDMLSVTYDGAKVRYLQNGVVLRTVAAAAGLKLYFDSSFATPAEIYNIQFGPYGHPSAVSPTNQINAGNVSTFIANAAIGTAQVGVLTAGNLTVTALSNTINGSASTGQRVEVAANVIRVYDSGGTIRVKLGDLS